MSLPLTHTAPVRDLQRKYRSLVNLAKRTRCPIVLINRSTPEAVIMDVGTYSALAEDAYPLDHDYALKLIQQARRSIKAGKIKSLKNWNELDA